MNRPDCKHPSAFCLMQFQTPDRSVEETVWNSRDMLVPQKIVRGKTELLHVDAHRDDFKPYHVPRVGTRIFIDPVLDKAEASAEAFYAEHHTDADFAKKFGEDRRDAIAKIVDVQLKTLADDGAKAGAVLVVVTPEIAARIQARLQKRGAV